MFFSDTVKLRNQKGCVKMQFDSNIKSTIACLPFDERPRERFLRFGEKNLTNAELLAIILGTGTKNESAVDLAKKLLIYYGGLHGLKDKSLEEFMKIKGIGQAKGMQVLSVIELAKRLNQLREEERYMVRSPQDGANYLWHELREEKQEKFVCLYLNVKNYVIDKKTIFIGSLNHSVVHPREIFKEAIRKAAASIICFHNHPSGDPTPSKEDIEVTKRLFECGKIIGIDLLDHIILGQKRYVSLKEKGYL